MKISSPLLHKKARIEIIPLIDIMFFLLASFMMASLSMIRLESIKMKLPTANTAKRTMRPDIVSIAIDQAGAIFIDKRSVDLPELHAILSNKFRVNTNVPVYIMGDMNASHGSITRVLDVVRREGIQTVSFGIAGEEAKQ